MNNSYKKLLNVQERASELYAPVKSDNEALICLNCPIPKCKPRGCKRYSDELKKLRKEETQNESN